MASLRGNQLQQLLAIDALAKSPVDPARQPAVAAELERVLNGNDRLVAQKSLDALYVWATLAQVPSLLRALDDSSTFVRRGAIQALGPLKDERAVAPVAKFLPSFGEREVAGRSLIAMGPMVESEVRKYLTSPDRFAREEASRVLRQVGRADPERDAFDAALGGLKDRWGQSKALEWFAAANPNHPRRAEVAAELARLLADRSSLVRTDAAKALVVWATPGQVPAMIAALREERSSVGAGPSLIEALGKQKDRRAVVPLARQLPNAFLVKPAVKALIALGPIAEDEVGKYLVHERYTAREGACQVLAEVGTPKSLPALREVLAKARREMYGGYHLVAEAARDAISSIEPRAK